MVSFDEYSAEYIEHVDRVVQFSGQDTNFFHEVKVASLLNLLSRRQDLKSLSVLDVGCGNGALAGRVAPQVRELVGIDISEASITLARQHISSCHFECYDGVNLPFDEGSFDFAFTSCVMHHVQPSQWRTFVAEMWRVVRPGGHVAVIEHNPWNPLTRLAVSRCEFDADAVLMTRRRVIRMFKRQSLTVVAKPYILYFPWRPQFLRRLETVIAGIPLGAQYIVMGEK
jgi:ubiquinone/menaquinone biosynthesis C-methylase UbiE